LKNQEECGAAAKFTEQGAIRFERKFRFLRKEHLKRRKDIQAVFKHGKYWTGQGAKLFILKNSLEYNRICLTFSRGFGNAVQRNRARRLGREAYRLIQPRLLHSGHDLVLLVFPEDHASLATRARQLEFLFFKAGLLQYDNNKV